jgi:hypothetical protein
MATLTPNAVIRELQDRFTAERPSMSCVYGVCDHQHTPIPLPAGVTPVTVTDYDGPIRQFVILVRYRTREGCGYHVVRADNGRAFGWVYRITGGDDDAGQWAGHIDSSAFRGEDVDDTGNWMDAVPHWLYHGDPHNSFVSNRATKGRTRDEAMREIVRQVAAKWAPAAGYPSHHEVRVYAARPEQHFPLGDNDDRCSCSETWPCRKREALLAGVGS